MWYKQKGLNTGVEGRKTLKNTLIDEFYFIEKKSLVAVIIPPVCTL